MIVTVTGSSGYLGSLVVPGLRRQGMKVLPFDRYRGPLVRSLRHTYLGTSSSRYGVAAARRIKRTLRRVEEALAGAGALRPTRDDILDIRGRLVERFRGSDAVVHLAAVAHPNVPGAAAEDYRRINFDGAVNVFEAAREAGVSRFVYSSSCQVYRINDPVRIDAFPIDETNPCPTLDEGQSPYGFLKRQFERYLEDVCAGTNLRAVSLRLETPGMRSRMPENFYISTSVENTVAAFVRALTADLPAGAHVFNVADAEVDPAIVDVQRFLAERFPHVPNRTRGNACLLSTEKAKRVLGYRPAPGGRYHELQVLW